MFRLDGKTALVTGASQGIGAAIARRFAEQGARVILAARTSAKLETVAAEIAEAGGEALVLRLDVSQPAEVAAQLAELPDGWPVEILVNNAGITRDALVGRMKLEQWQEVIDTNLTGAYAVTRELVRAMMRRRWGRVIFISSVVGMMGNLGQANYSAAKAGLIGFSKTLARELGSRGVTVNVVAPGLIETAMTAELSDRARQRLSDAIILRRFGTVDDVAAAAFYLASEVAGYVTGEVLSVSGGLYV